MFGFGGSFDLAADLQVDGQARHRRARHRDSRATNPSTGCWKPCAARRRPPASACRKSAIYDAPETNAFATGASRNKALVAVSTGLLRAMNRDEAEAVLGHEISHVANGDMVTMTLMQGVLNTFVIVLARVVGRVVDGYSAATATRRRHRLLRHRVRAATWCSACSRA